MHKITLWANFVIWNLKMTQHCFYINIWTVFLTFLFPKYGPHPIKRQNVDFTLEIFFFLTKFWQMEQHTIKPQFLKEYFAFSNTTTFSFYFGPPPFFYVFISRILSLSGSFYFHILIIFSCFVLFVCWGKDKCT